jgi:ornithine carbamoyltransferase
MSFNLRRRSFRKELDYSPAEWRFLLRQAAELTAAKYSGTETPRLTGKNIALIFEKTRPALAAHSRWPRTTKART